MYNLKNKFIRWIKKGLFDISATFVIIVSCFIWLLGIVIIAIFLTELKAPLLFIYILGGIGCFGFFYIHYKVTKYLERFEKEKSDKDKEIDNLFEWNPKK